MFTDQQNTILLYTSVFYFFLLVAISVWVGVKHIKTYDDFNVASRNVGLFPLILTILGTAVGGATLLGFMTNGYNSGMGEHWFNISVFVAGLVMALFMLRKIRERGEEFSYVTIGDFVAHRFGDGARLPAALAVLTAYAAITGMQFVAIAGVLNLVADVPLTIGIFASAIMLTLKTIFGGLKVVIWQDAIHGTIQTIAVFALFVLVILNAGDFDTMRANAEAVGEVQHLSLFGIGFAEVMIYTLTLGAYQLVRQDLWQRAWAGKDLKTSINGYWIAIVLALITGAIVVTIGVFARHGMQLQSEDPALLYYEVINELMSFELVLVLIVALLATVISCADSFFMCGASSIVNDLVLPRVKSIPSQKTLLLYSRLSVVATGVIALVLSLSVTNLVDLWTTGTAMLVSGLLFQALVALYAKRVSGRGAIASMWAGLLVSVVWTIIGSPFGHPVFLGLPIGIIVYAIFHYVDRDKLGNYLGEPPHWNDEISTSTEDEDVAVKA